MIFPLLLHPALPMQAAGKVHGFAALTHKGDNSLRVIEPKKAMTKLSGHPGDFHFITDSCGPFNDPQFGLKT